MGQHIQDSPVTTAITCETPEVPQKSLERIIWELKNVPTNYTIQIVLQKRFLSADLKPTTVTILG